MWKSYLDISGAHCNSAHMRTLAQETGISGRGKLSHSREYCGMQILIPAWGTASGTKVFTYQWLHFVSAWHDDVIKWKHFPRSFDVFFDLRLNWRLSKQSWGWWFEKPSRSLWRHYNEWRHIDCRYHIPFFKTSHGVKDHRWLYKWKKFSFITVTS